MQQEVKIIGLRLNQSLGILQSFHCEFNQDNRIIPIKGAVGSGKTTLQRGLSLGTRGANTLKDDKSLFGDIDQEVCLLDGEQKIFVGCKSEPDGSLKFTLYTRNEDGKKVENPVIDGVKATPASYLKSLQTSLTWKMNEITSENPTVQKKILLELYKDELARVGVIFDKSDENYSDSILGLLDKKIQERKEADVMRKHHGGFKSHLLERGINVDLIDESEYQDVDIEPMLKKEASLMFAIENAESEALKARNEIVRKLDEEIFEHKKVVDEYNLNVKIRNEQNQKEREGFEAKKKDIESRKQTIKTNLDYLKSEGLISESGEEAIVLALKENISPLAEPQVEIAEIIDFEPADRVVCPANVLNARVAVMAKRAEKHKLFESELDINTSSSQEELDVLRRNIEETKSLNNTSRAVRSYKRWESKEKEVRELRKKYVKMLSMVDTGVPGLMIVSDDKDESSDMYLTYDGRYNPEYFNNHTSEYRKLSSYSGTQKPMICLLIQNHLLSKLNKAMRYIWIDDVPIDLSTRELLNKMAEELNLRIIINITGDFSKDSLDSGDILLDGGEVFFN